MAPEPPASTPSQAEAPCPAKPRAILEAAASLFLERGYAAVSMDAVARRAGVSKATLYAYFRAKDALFAAVVAERCERMSQEAAAAASHNAELFPALHGLATAVLASLLTPVSIAMHRMVLAEVARAPELARAFYEAGPSAGIAHMACWIAEEQRRGRLRVDADPLVAARHLHALLRGDLWMRVGLGVAPTPDAAAIEAEAAAAVTAFLRAYGQADEAAA